MVVPASDVVDTVMVPVTLQIVPPSDPALMAVCAFLDQSSVAVEGITCMSDDLKKVTSMVQVASVVPGVPTVQVVDEVAEVGAVVPLATEFTASVPAPGLNAEVALSEVVSPTPATVSGVDVEIYETNWTAYSCCLLLETNFPVTGIGRVNYSLVILMLLC